ncbi:hypothetical protein F5880DRAFT_1619095 [Lentinula raphanica]|nr:hypothetical protein F5880DRAFT_1619095 [Lentinula raphanica]
MAQTEPDSVTFADFVIVNYPPTNKPSTNNPSNPPAKTPPRSWEPNLSVERLPLRERHVAGFELCDDLFDCDEYDISDQDDLSDEDNLSEEADLESPPSTEAVVFTSTLARMSGYTDYSPELYDNLPAKVVVAKFSSNSVWILVGSLHSVMPTAIIPACHSHLDSVFAECKIQHKIFLVHDLSSVVENVHTRLTLRFTSKEFQDLCHALGSNSSNTSVMPISPDWGTWLSVIHEFKNL